jgi:hypothetical protein
MTRGQRLPGAPRDGLNVEASSRNRINAGVGGIGGGTGLIAIAQQVGLHTVLGQVLLYLSPAVSVVSGAAIYQLKLRVDWYNEKSVVKKARRTLEGQLKDPHTSEGYKAKIRSMLEELDHTVAKAEVARVKSIKR